MVLEDEMKKGEASGETSEKMGLSRKNSGSSLSPTEDDEEDEDKKLELGPMIALKEQLERDKVFYFVYLYEICKLYHIINGEKMLVVYYILGILKYELGEIKINNR